MMMALFFNIIYTAIDCTKYIFISMHNNTKNVIICNKKHQEKKNNEQQTNHKLYKVHFSILYG